MINRLQIRDALLADLTPIVEIYNASIPNNLATGDTSPISVQSRLAWFEEHSPETYPLWVVENEDQRIVGWLGFQCFYGRPAYHKTAELSIYIAPNCQNQGIGKVLLEKAIKESPSLGLKTLIGFIFGHNNPSLALFTRYGFKEWGFLPQVAELGEQERDLVILGKRIVDN
ncbi:MAG: GNAT family N-acetyltransferase [Microcystaceae cyanobacterium]